MPLALPRFILDALPGLGMRLAATRHEGHFVFTPAELRFEARRRGISPSDVLTVGCQACGASATWPVSVFFAHYSHCLHADAPSFLQFMVRGTNGRVRFVNPPSKLMDQLHDEQ